jgi:hypothetical protein
MLAIRPSKQNTLKTGLKGITNDFQKALFSFSTEKPEKERG